MPQHAAAHEWLNGELNGATRVALPWGSLVTFARVAANARVWRTPMTLVEVRTQLEEWLELPNVWVPQPTDRHSVVFGELLVQPGMRSDMVPDAHLAAVSIEHGLTVCSHDTHFARFRGVRWQDPLS